MSPKQVMEGEIAAFNKLGFGPYKINDGWCEQWAENVFDQLQDTNNCVEIWATPFGFADTNHIFLRINGKFHDAEMIDGCDDHMELPIFAKLLEKGCERQPVWRENHNGKIKPDSESKRDMTDEMVAKYNQENGIQQNQFDD